MCISHLIIVNKRLLMLVWIFGVGFFQINTTNTVYFLLSVVEINAKGKMKTK